MCQNCMHRCVCIVLAGCEMPLSGHHCAPVCLTLKSQYFVLSQTRQIRKDFKKEERTSIKSLMSKFQSIYTAF